MAYSQFVREKIDALKPGEVFSARLLDLDSTASTRKIFSRLESQGVIERMKGAQGLYYIPIEGIYAPVGPSRGKVIKTLLQVSTGYLSGLGLYNRLGLTTQVSSRITIVSNKFPRTTKVEGFEVEYKKARVPITPENILLLQYLDVLVDIRNIPDANPNFVLEVIESKFKKLKESEIELLVELAKSYPKRVTALVGAMLEKIYGSKFIKPISDIKKIGSIYKVGVDNKYLPNKKDWNIV